MKRKTWILMAGAALILVVAVLLGVSIRTKYSSAESVPARYGDLVEAVYGLGTVTATQSYQLKIGVTASVLKIFVHEGEQVPAGSPLVRLDHSDSVFKAPFAGTVTSIPFKVGETVYPQMPVMTLMNLKDRYIVVSLEQEGALRVKPGQVARMSVESLRGQVFEGKVRTLFPGENQFLVYIDIPSLPEEILPGMTGDVAIEVSKKSHVLLIPASAVQSGRVLMKTKRLPKSLQVKLGASDGRWVEVLSDEIHDGDEVLLPKR